MTKLSWTEQDMLLSNKGETGGEEEEEKEGRASQWRFAGSAWQTGREMGKQGGWRGDWTRGRGGVVKVSGLRLKILALHFDVWYCVNPP